MKSVNIGVVGCGNISRIYLENLTHRFENTRVLAVSNRNMEKAIKTAEIYGVPKTETLEEMENDPEIELVVNLTTPDAHLEITKRFLEAGKHVYSEKALAIDTVSAKEILACAKKNQRFIGCAPDIFLGRAQQEARKALEKGIIGKVHSVSMNFLNHGPEHWHPEPDYFYHKGGGPVFDMAPYYLTALIALLGPVEMVAGICTRESDVRHITSPRRSHDLIQVEVPTHVTGSLLLRNGVNCSVTYSYDCHSTTLPHIELHGESGTMILPDPNLFGGCVYVRRSDETEFRSLYKEDADDRYNLRGIGISDMAHGIRSGETPRANGQMACHITEIMEALHQSWETKTYQVLETTCEIPPLFK